MKSFTVGVFDLSSLVDRFLQTLFFTPRPGPSSCITTSRGDE
jgi:hypothetical protein